MSKKHTFNIFTDGSSLIDGSFYEASSAVCVYYEGDVVFEVGKYHRGGTNSLGEVFAVQMALDNITEFLDYNKLELKNVHINIFSDSDYVVRSLTEYVNSWKRVGRESKWISSQGTPVAHQEIIKHIYYEYLTNNKYDIDIFHMRGHVGEKITIPLAYAKFCKKNKVKISIDDFKKLVKCNHQVDKFAEYMRVNKAGIVKRSGTSKWLIWFATLEKENGLIRIRKRIR